MNPRDPNAKAVGSKGTMPRLGSDAPAGRLPGKSGSAPGIVKKKVLPPGLAKKVNPGLPVGTKGKMPVKSASSLPVGTKGKMGDRAKEIASALPKQFVKPGGSRLPAARPGDGAPVRFVNPGADRTPLSSPGSLKRSSRATEVLQRLFDSKKMVAKSPGRKRRPRRGGGGNGRPGPLKG